MSNILHQYLLWGIVTVFILSPLVLLAFMLERYFKRKDR